MLEGEANGEMNTSRWFGIDGAGTAEFTGTLANGCKAHTGAPAITEAVPIVDDLDRESVTDREANDTIPGIGMAGSVRDAFQRDAIGHDLERSGERWQVLRGVDRDDDRTRAGTTGAAILERVLANRRDEAEVIERRRTKAVDKAANIRNGILGLVTEFGDEVCGSSRVSFQEVASSVELEGECSEGRADAVVEVAADAAAFLFPGIDEALAGTLEVGGEADAVGCNAGLAGEVAQDLTVFRVEVLANDTGSE